MRYEVEFSVVAAIQALMRRHKQLLRQICNKINRPRDNISDALSELVAMPKVLA